MKKFTLIILGVLFSVLCFAQDPSFTNTQQSLIYLNPSFSGSNGFIRNQVVYRNQWPSISGPTYVTIGNAFDAYIKPMKGGISASIISDDLNNGTLKTTWYSFAYAQYFSLFNNKLKIVPSIQVSYLQETLDKTKLNFGDPVNARYGMIFNNPGIVPVVFQKNLNFSSGILFYYSKLIIGASVFNINHPDIGLTGAFPLPVRTCLNASYNTAINPRAIINLSAVSNFQMGFSNTQLRATYIYKYFILGLGYFYSQGRTSYGRQYYYGFIENYMRHGLLANVVLHFKNINISYMFDKILIENSKYKYPASHEISLSLNFRNKKETEPKIGMEFW